MKKYLYSLLLLIFLSGSCILSFAQPTGYLYVRQITINESQIPDGTNLSNFPVLIKFTHADLRSVANGGHVENNNGFDIIFFANSCATPLDHQLDYYDPTTGEVNAWVRIPVLSTTADTRIYMYYGNNTVVASTSLTSTWNTGYNGIWHLTESPAVAAPQMTDATGNAHNGTANGGMTASDLVSGKIGRALNFDEVNDYVRIPDFLYGQELTLSFWFNASEVNGNSYQYLFSHGTWAAPNSMNIYMGEDNITIPSEIQNRNMLKTVFRDNNDANNYDTLDAGNTWVGGWHYYTMRIQDFGGATIYIDGTQVAVYSVWGANTFNPTTDIFLAGREDLNSGRHYGGLLDEVRISSVWRSSNWIRTEYNNQSDPATFASVGVEGTYVSFCVALSLPLNDFIAVRAGNTVNLQWKPADLDNAGYYSIERSTNGVDWQLIGTSYKEHSYSDSSAPATNLYYRIKFHENSKVFTSEIRAVAARCCRDAIVVYPNPSPSGQFMIELPSSEDPEQFMLLDASGVIIPGFKIEKKYSGTYQLRINGVHSKGVYFLRFRYANNYHTKRLVL